MPCAHQAHGRNHSHNRGLGQSGTLWLILVYLFVHESAAASKKCHQRALAFARANPLGFQVERSNALKRITAQLPAFREQILKDMHLKQHERDALSLPIIVDVGAAAFGPPEFFSGSDSLLVLKAFHNVSVDVHAFDMERSVTVALRKDAASLLRTAARGSSHTVYHLGVGAARMKLLASPMQGTDKKRTLTLTGGSGHSRKGNAFTTEVTSLDAWEGARAFNRSIFYVKVDVNGHEPPVLLGLRRLLSERPPLLMSFEYSSGWHPIFANVTAQLVAARAAAGRRGARVPRAVAQHAQADLFHVDAASISPSLRGFVANLSHAGYAVYLLHEHGPIRMDGPWWHGFYELELNEQVKAPKPYESWDFVAARRGAPRRAFERLFLFHALPCLAVPGALPGACKERTRRSPRHCARSARSRLMKIEV